MTLDLFLGLFFCLVLIVRGMELFGAPVPSDWVVLRPLRDWAVEGHDSDCSLHNAPAYRPWPCSCQLEHKRPIRNWLALRLQQKAFDEGVA